MANKTEKNKNTEEKLKTEENIEKIYNEKLDSEEYIAKLNEELQEQTKKAEEYYDHLKRNMADFDNFKKRVTKEKETLYVSVVSDIIEELLPIMDNFEQAICHECTDETFKQGTEMIFVQIKDIISKYGVEEIKALGETFNPEYHEAVMHIDSDKYGEKKIIEVLRKGYKLKGKIIRHSMVKVAN